MIYNVDENGVFGPYGHKASLKIKAEYSEWFEHAYKVSYQAHIFLSQFQPRQFDTPAMLITTLFVRGLSQFQGVILLCQHGLTNEARVVLRSLIELVIYLRAIDSDDSFAKDYLEKHDRERKLLLKKALRSDFLRSQAWDFDLVAERDKISKDLSGREIKFEKYAEAAGLVDVYYALYSVLSGSVHSGVKDLEMHLDADSPDEVKNILYGVSDDQIDFLLYAATEMIVAAVRSATDRFNIEFSPDFESLLKYHIEIGSKIGAQG